MLNSMLGLVLFLLGYGAILASHFAWWDRSVLDPTTFSTLYRGQEHRLIQQLSAYREDGKAPAVELVTLNLSFAATEKLSVWLALSGSLLLGGAALLSLETTRWRNSWARHWQPALVMTASMLLPLPVLHVLAGVVRAPALGSKIEALPSQRFTSNTGMERVLDHLQRWSEENDYEVELRGTWKLERIHNRETVARVFWVEAFRRSVFDRWGISWRGRERRTPWLRIQCLSGVEPAESVVSIDTGPVREGSTQDEEWRAVLDKLHAALKESGQ
jgi:hypothetical protein